MRFEHVIFDLDGTLIDSRQDLADAANVLLDGYGAAPLPTADVVGMVGEGARLLVQRIVMRAAVTCDLDEALERFLAAYDRCLVAHSRPYDGVESMLDALGSAGATLAVLTNKPQAPTERILDHLGLSRWFSRIVGGDTPHGRKPSPEGLHALMAAAGVPPPSTLMVGDSWVDVATAHAAGVDACLVSYGFDHAAATASSRPAARWVAATPADVTDLALQQRPPAPSMPPGTRA